MKGVKCYGDEKYFGILKRTCDFILNQDEKPLTQEICKAVLSSSSQSFKYFLETQEVREPVNDWILFLGLLRGMQRFCERGIPTDEHEPELTGMLRSNLMDKLEEVGRKVEEAGEVVNVQVAWGNTTTGHTEKFTGADFGLIFRVGDNDFVSLLIQVKKVSGTSADVSQPAGNTGGLQRNVLGQEPNLGHYLFMHARRGEVIPPLTMCSAETVNTYCKGDMRRFPSLEKAYDALLYLSLVPFCHKQTVGVKKDSPEGAVEVLFTNVESVNGFEDRLMVLDVGGENFDNWANIDWNEKIKKGLNKELDSETRRELETKLKRTSHSKGPKGPGE